MHLEDEVVCSSLCWDGWSMQGVGLLLSGEVAAALPQLASMGCHGGIRSCACWYLRVFPAGSTIQVSRSFLLEDLASTAEPLCTVRVQ
jgi:hypothetical protein